MKGRFEAINDFYNNPSEYFLVQLKDVLLFNEISGHMKPHEVQKVLELAESYMNDGIDKR